MFGPDGAGIAYLAGTVLTGLLMLIPTLISYRDRAHISPPPASGAARCRPRTGGHRMRLAPEDQQATLLIASGAFMIAASLTCWWFGIDLRLHYSLHLSPALAPVVARLSALGGVCGDGADRPWSASFPVRAEEARGRGLAVPDDRDRPAGNRGSQAGRGAAAPAARGLAGSCRTAGASRARTVPAR